MIYSIVDTIISIKAKHPIQNTLSIVIASELAHYLLWSIYISKPKPS